MNSRWVSHELVDSPMRRFDRPGGELDDSEMKFHMVQMNLIYNFHNPIYNLGVVAD